MTNLERAKEFLSQDRFKDCAFEVKVIHDTCRFTKDITDDECLSSIVELFRTLLKKGFDPGRAKILMPPELQAILFPDYDVVIIDGYALPLVADPNLTVTKQEDGSLLGDIWIGNIRVQNVRIEEYDVDS